MVYTIFVKNSLIILDVGKCIISGCYFLEINFKLNSLWHEVGLYKLPNLTVNPFLVGLDIYLFSFLRDKKVLIFDDTNVNILSNSTEFSEYLNDFANKNYILCINVCTKVTNTSKSCINHIFIKHFKVSFVSPYVIKIDFTDHYNLAICFNFKADNLKFNRGTGNEN